MEKEIKELYELSKEIAKEGERRMLRLGSYLPIAEGIKIYFPIGYKAPYEEFHIKFTNCDIDIWSWYPKIDLPISITTKQLKELVVKVRSVLGDLQNEEVIEDLVTERVRELEQEIARLKSVV